MANVARVKLLWSGFPGGPGMSVFHFGIWPVTDPTAADCAAAVARVDAFAESIKQFTAKGVSMTVQSDVEIIQIDNGKLVRMESTTPAAPHNSPSGAGTLYAGPVGAVINWTSPTIRTLKRSKRMQGRTFLVPLNGSVFSDTGTLNSTNLGVMQSAATALRTAGTGPNLVIYGRPSSKGATDGTLGLVTGHRMPTKAAVMRSRRD